MARILGAVASSHTPTIGFALDTHKEHDPAWTPIFEGYKPVQRWLAEQQSYCLPSMTGIATAIYEDDAVPAPPDADYLAHIHRQLAGIEKLSGTYPFTLARSVKGYRLNKFLHNLIEPAWRVRFRSDQDALFETAGLTPRNVISYARWIGAA